MADALFELAQVLTHSKVKMTQKEAELILACRSKSLRDATLGSAVAGGLVWMATGRLSRFFRYSLAGGVGFVSGMWRLNKSLDSCVDHILAMEGTRMKHELAKIMVRRYGNDPQRMHLISKHFFSEEVFDDSISDQPKRMYRQRNTYIDNAAQIQRSSDNYGHDDSASIRKVDNSQKKEDNDIERLRKTVLESRLANTNVRSLEPDDPLDCLFGHSDVNEEILHPTYNSSSPTKQQTRRQRRLQRRHRLHHRHRDNPSTTEDS